MTETEPSSSVVGVLDLSDVVLASLASTAAPEIVQEVAQESEAEPEAAEETKGPKVQTEEVAYVHVPDCIACHACAEECPSGAIEVVDHSVIDPNICEACNKCVPVCPTSCISIQPRSGYAQLEFAVK